MAPAHRGTPRRLLGVRGERIAAEYLRQAGYRILARNLRWRDGELDLVALERDALCFIEVRARSSPRFGAAEESIDARKRARIVHAARRALAEHRWPRHGRLRFDVVAIDAAREPPRVRLLRDAFRADGL
jgi:putative endonuclease